MPPDAYYLATTVRGPHNLRVNAEVWVEAVGLSAYGTVAAVAATMGFGSLDGGWAGDASLTAGLLALAAAGFYLVFFIGAFGRRIPYRVLEPQAPWRRVWRGWLRWPRQAARFLWAWQRGPFERLVGLSTLEHGMTRHASRRYVASLLHGSEAKDRIEQVRQDDRSGVLRVAVLPPAIALVMAVHWVMLRAGLWSPYGWSALVVGAVTLVAFTAFFMMAVRHHAGRVAAWTEAFHDLEDGFLASRRVG